MLACLFSAYSCKKWYLMLAVLKWLTRFYWVLHARNNWKSQPNRNPWTELRFISNYVFACVYWFRKFSNCVYFFLQTLQYVRECSARHTRSVVKIDDVKHCIWLRILTDKYIQYVYESLKLRKLKWISIIISSSLLPFCSMFSQNSI